MKKYISILLIVGVGIVLLFRFVFHQDESEWSQVYRQYLPHDTNYQAIEYTTYQPASVPALSNKTSGFKLPKGVSETDVKKVISVELSSDSASGKKRLDIIETKSGEIFVRKDSNIERITVTEFVPPVFSFDWRFGIGASLGYRERFQFSPSVVFAPLEWYGKFQAPIFTADLDGIGAGAQLQVYHDIYLGAVNVWRYDVGRDIKATVQFMF